MTGRLPRLVVYGVAVVMALGVLGYAFRDPGNSTSPAVGVGSEPAIGEVDDGYMAQIDAALGRPSASEVAEAAKRGAADSILPGAPEITSQAQSEPRPAGGSGSTPLTTTEDRKIVQTGSLKLQVERVGEGFEEVGRIASGAGGFVASSNFSFVGEQQIASVSIRVPANRYQEVLSQLRALGKKVDSEASNASDITEQYSDLSAQLRNYEATETQLLTLLGRADAIQEILQVQDPLNSVRGQVEQVKGRLNLLTNLSEMATVTVHLRPVAGAVSNGGNVDLGDKVSEAWDDSIAFLTEIAGGVITAVVFLWWLPLVAVPAYAVLRRLTLRQTAAVDGSGA